MFEVRHGRAGPAGKCPCTHVDPKLCLHCTLMGGGASDCRSASAELKKAFIAGTRRGGIGQRRLGGREVLSWRTRRRPAGPQTPRPRRGPAAGRPSEGRRGDGRGFGQTNCGLKRDSPLIAPLLRVSPPSFLRRANSPLFPPFFCKKGHPPGPLPRPARRPRCQPRRQRPACAPDRKSVV